MNLNGDTRPGGPAPIVDMIIGANGAGGQKRISPVVRTVCSTLPENFGGEGFQTSGLKIADLDNDGDLDMVETQRGEGTLDSGTNIVYVNRNGTLRSLFDDEQSLDSTKNDRSSGVVIGDVNGDTKLDVVISNETTGGHDVGRGESNELPVSQHDDRGQHRRLSGPRFGSTQWGPRSTRAACCSSTWKATAISISSQPPRIHPRTEPVSATCCMSTPAAPPIRSTIRSPPPYSWPRARSITRTSPTRLRRATSMATSTPTSCSSRPGRTRAASARNRYYINNSTPGSINFETTGTFGTADNHTNVRLADFDNDGDRDLITTVFEGGNVLHRNVGAPTYFDAGFQLLDPFNAADASRAVDFADLQKR